jgi:catechol 2,3-dioxygenase-like lactoylglutathione lyase family enzyme
MLRAMDPSDWDWSEHVVDHLDVRASDYDESVRFYTTVLRPLRPLGIPSWPEHTDAERATCFTRVNVVDRQPPTRDLHLCFRARSREAVDASHRAGLEAGFRSNGEPGYRAYDAGYYAAYLLDPDGNNVEALYRDVGNVGHEP